MVNVGEYTTIHGILCVFHFVQTLQASIVHQTRRTTPSLDWYFLFCLGKLTMVPFEKLSTHHLVPSRSTKNNRPQKGSQCFGGFQIPPVCNPKCLSLLHQGKYEDAEQVKSGSWVQIASILDFEGQQVDVLQKWVRIELGSPCWKWQLGMFFSKSSEGWIIYDVNVCPSFFVVSKDAQFQGKIFLRYGTQKVMIFSKHIILFFLTWHCSPSTPYSHPSKPPKDAFGPSARKGRCQTKRGQIWTTLAIGCRKVWGRHSLKLTRHSFP